jgi:hypothetical protein
MVTPTSIDLDHLKKILDIARDSGVQSMAIGEVSFTFKEKFTPQSALLEESKEDRLKSIKEQLEALNEDADADTYWSV